MRRPDSRIVLSSFLLALPLAALAPGLSSCALPASGLEPRSTRTVPSPPSADESAATRPTPTAAPAPAAPRALPALDQEPLLRVLIAHAPSVVLEIGAATKLAFDGGELALGPGKYVLAVQRGGWTLGPQGGATTATSRAEAVLASGGRPIFALDALPEFGKPVRVRLAGDLVLRVADSDTPGLLDSTRGVEVIERVRMEDYLASVVGAEMNPKWPTAALAAQAIVARSYAAARWMERSDEPWQLHWHFGVDMAYHGWSEKNAVVASAIASTRGEVLMYSGFPVLALFHASSGGRTESFERVKPGVFAPDGKTPIAAAMPVVDDPAALSGATGLALAASHGWWKADIPLPEVTTALQGWSKAGGGRPSFGEVEAVSIEERHEDSRRVASVSVRHRLDGKTRYTTMDASDFRMAVSPVRVRSLWWERCVIASRAPGYLVLEGRGFGHGCGLSQVSAWELARQGESPESIVKRFYAGAKIERRY